MTLGAQTRRCYSIIIIIIIISGSPVKSKKYTLTLLWSLFYHLAPLPPPPLPVCGNKFTTDEDKKDGRGTSGGGDIGRGKTIIIRVRNIRP